MSPYRLSLLAILFSFTMTGAVACAVHSGSAAASATTAAGNRVGEFVWQDLMTDDIATSRAFYEQLFGWQFEQTSRLGKPYFIARAGSGPVGGMALVKRRQPDEPCAQWLSYLAVSDVEAVAKRVTASGGQLLVSPTAVNTNRAAVAVDPQGAPVGLVQLGPTVILPTGGPSAPVGTFFWRDYLARDADTARTFYADLAGLGADRQSRADLMLHYVLTRPGSASAPSPVAGVIAIGERKISPHWLPYIRVNDPAETAARAQQLGGRVILAASPEIRSGSVAVIADPNGAAMALQKWPI
jgi:predicted enzyme related to lactoylglutathione lyase